MSCISREENGRSVGRPGWIEIRNLVVGQWSLVGAIPGHHENLEISVAVAGESDLASIWREARGSPVVRVGGELPNRFTVGECQTVTIHGPYSCGNFKDNRFAVRGPPRSVENEP